MPVGASVWNNKTSNGSHLFSFKGNTESGWRVCCSFVWIVTWNGRRISLDFKNDGIDGTGISLFLHPVYFIQFSMSQMKEGAKFMPKNKVFGQAEGGMELSAFIQRPETGMDARRRLKTMMHISFSQKARFTSHEILYV